MRIGKPYGIYGITMARAGDPGLRIMRNNGLDEATKGLLDDARFVFLRDGASLKVVKDAGVKAPVVEFGPDGAFGADVRDDEAAIAFLKAHGLEEGRFLCCIPNLRNAPYWRIKPGYAFDEGKHRRNEEMKEHDHVLLREAIVAVVRRAGMKVLVCPEDATQMREGKELLVDPLPDDVKPSRRPSRGVLADRRGPQHLRPFGGLLRQRAAQRRSCAPATASRRSSVGSSSRRPRA